MNATMIDINRLPELIAMAEGRMPIPGDLAPGSPESEAIGVLQDASSDQPGDLVPGGRGGQEHPTRTLITCCGDAAPIDKLMVPLVAALWRHGVHTQICCQGEPGALAYVTFPDIGEADKFGDLLLAGYDPHGPLTPLAATCDPWRWELTPRFPLMTRGFVTVRFPHELIDAVAEHIAARDGISREIPTPEEVPVHPRAGEEDIP